MQNRSKSPESRYALSNHGSAERNSNGTRVNRNRSNNSPLRGAGNHNSRSQPPQNNFELIRETSAERASKIIREARRDPHSQPSEAEALSN